MINYQGRNWMLRNSSTSYGNFIDLTDNGNEIIGATTKGVFASKNGGRNWMKRS